MERVEPTRIMFAVSESKRYGYPHPSGISRRAFQWTLEKIVLNNTNAFRFSFIHVHSPGTTNAQSERNNINGNALLQYFANRCNERQINDYEVINVVGLHVGKIICKEAKRRMPILLIVGRIVQRQRPRTGLNRLTSLLWLRRFCFAINFPYSSSLQCRCRLTEFHCIQIFIFVLLELFPLSCLFRGLLIGLILMVC